MIEPLEARDADAVAAISRASFPRGWTPEEVIGAVSRAIGLGLVAREEGRVLGYVIGWVAGGEAEVVEIAVAPEARRRAIGRRLLGAWIGAAVARGAEVAHLEVRANATPARALYRAAGFHEVGVRAGYYADGTDAILMTWEWPRR